MLTTIREKTQGWIAAILIGLGTIPFALWGINTYFEGGGRLNVAEVNGADISVDSYKRTLEDQRRSLQQMLGRDADVSATGLEARLRRDALIRQADSGFAQSAIVMSSDIQALLKLQTQLRE